jgi:NADPH:quinone reductase-like Zn-dependent oxidoreductase
LPARWLVRDDMALAPEQLATIPLVLATAVHAVNPVGGTAMPGNLESLKARGTIVNLGLSGGAEAKIPHLYPFFRNERRIVGAWMGSMAELEFGLDLVKQCKVRPVLHKTLPLKQVREAHRMIASHEVHGKTRFTAVGRLAADKDEHSLGSNSMTKRIKQLQDRVILNVTDLTPLDNESGG